MKIHYYAMVCMLYACTGSCFAQHSSDSSGKTDTMVVIMTQPEPQIRNVYAGNAGESTENRGMIGGGGYYHSILKVSPRYEIYGDSILVVMLGNEQITNDVKQRQDPGGLALLSWSFALMDIESPARLVTKVKVYFDGDSVVSSEAGAGIYKFPIPKGAKKFDKLDVHWNWGTRNSFVFTFDGHRIPGSGMAGWLKWLIALLLATLLVWLFNRMRKKKDKKQKQEPQLISDFALNEFKRLSADLKQADFIAWIIIVFGADIPVDAAAKILKALQDNTFDNPEIKLVPQAALQGHLASYTEADKTIRVAEQAPKDALSNNEAAISLMVALIEEFGHHVDHVLRNQYSAVGGDAPLDEGARFAHSAIAMSRDMTEKISYATYIEPAEDENKPARRHILSIELAGRMKAADMARAGIEDDQKTDTQEFFGSGNPKDDERGSYTHLTILQKAFEGKNIYTPQEIGKIYFGNWLRDFSQAVDPKTVYSEAHNPYGFSRETLAAVIDVLAEVSCEGGTFGPYPEEKTAQTAFKNQFRVTVANLGAYLPKEHIDNPKGIDNFGQNINQSLGADVFRGPCQESETQVDASGLKHYIAESVTYIREELAAARNLGRNSDEGLRHFGNALHVLEDFFAHSNVAELMLYYAGQQNVELWAKTQFNGRHPVVTGRFGGSDTATSIMLEVGEILSKTDLTQVGERSKGQKIFLILLRDKSQRLAGYYDAFLTNVEDFKKTYPLLWMVWDETVGKVSELVQFSIGMVLRGIANQSDEIQAIQENEAGDGTNPTHTQIAKDHFDRHFHKLAGRLAVVATGRVAEAMAAVYQGNLQLDAVNRLLDGIFVHPSEIYDDNKHPDNTVQETHDALKAVVSTWLAEPGSAAELERGRHVTPNLDAARESLKEVSDKIDSWTRLGAEKYQEVRGWVEDKLRWIEGRKK